jgi:hypothetical protein
MTIVSTAALSTSTSAIVSEFSGGSSSNVAMFIGIGLVKDSDAVFFQYQNEGEQPVALLQPSGKHLSTLANVTLVDVSLYEPKDEYNTLKVNITLESSSGTQVMVTSGLTTFWSQSVVGGLLAMLKGGDVTCPFNLDTWRGSKGKIKPCFGAVKINRESMRNDEIYNALVDARADGNKQLVETIMRDAVDVLSAALKVTPAIVSLDEVTEKVPADF